MSGCRVPSRWFILKPLRKGDHSVLREDVRLDYDLLNHLNPKILDVVVRNEDVWRHFRHEIFRKSTRLHAVCFVNEGEGSLGIDDDVYALAPGSLFQIKPGIRMHIRSQERNPLRFLSIHYTGLLANGSGQSASAWAGWLPFPPHTKLEEWQTLHQRFQNAWSEWNAKQPGYEWRCKLRFLEMLDEIVRSVHVREEGPDPAVKLSWIIHYINQHYEKPIERETLAAFANLSPSYFSTVFKSRTGYSPIQYVNKVRIDRAKELLRSTSLPISEIASSVGFMDSFYFTRVFTRATGFSPSQYRKA